MRTHDRPSDTGSRSERETSGTSSESATRQPQQGGGEVTRPVPSATEPRGGRLTRGGWGRSAFTTSPWEAMRNLSDEVDRLLDNIAGVRSRAMPYGLTSQRGERGIGDFGGFQPGVWAPQIEIVQQPNAVLVRADLPGLRPEDVDVSVEDGMLTLSGERKQEQREEGEGFVRTERSYGQFFRSIPLPDGADEEKVNASFKNGVLEINVPVTGRQGGRKIKVQGA